MDIMEYVFTIVAIVYTIVCRISGHIDLTSEENAIQGKQLTFVCKTTTLSNTVTFFNPQTTIAGSCTYPDNKCGSGHGYKLSQNKSSLRTFLTIDHLNRSLHQGIWKCKYGQEEAQMNINIITFPDSILLEGLKTDINLNVTSMGTINITCSCSCVYPNVVFDLSLEDESSEYKLQSYTYREQNIDTSFNCEDNLENAYISEFYLSIRHDLLLLNLMTARVKCYASVSGIRVPLFAKSEGRIIFPVSSYTSRKPAHMDKENGVNVGAIVGSVVGVILFVIVAVIVMIVFFRRFKTSRNSNSNTSGNKVPYTPTNDSFEIYSVSTNNTSGNNVPYTPTNDLVEIYSGSTNTSWKSTSTRNAFFNTAQNMPHGKIRYVHQRITHADNNTIEERGIIEFEKKGKREDTIPESLEPLDTSRSIMD